MCFGSFRREPANPLQNEPAGAGDGRLDTKKNLAEIVGGCAEAAHGRSQWVEGGLFRVSGRF